MKFSYFADIDQLYIGLNDGVGSDSEEISDGVVVDYDKDGRVVGFDIEWASKKIDLTTIDLGELAPLQDARKAA